MGTNVDMNLKAQLKPEGTCRPKFKMKGMLLSSKRRKKGMSRVYATVLANNAQKRGY